MSDHSLNIGDVKIFDYPVTLTCYGLGSCVGLFVQDRAKGIAGGAHILLPDDHHGINQEEDSSKWYTVEKAIDKILEQFHKKGSLLQTLRAKVAGGANVLNSSISVGQRNVESVINRLIQHKIYIAATDTGGSHCRTVRFNSESGDLLIKTPLYNFYKVL